MGEDTPRDGLVKPPTTVPRHQDTRFDSGSDAHEAHVAWHDALETWAALSSGGHGLDTGGRSRRYLRHPFLLVFEDADLADLREFGRRGIARAGLIANALAGLVLPTDDAHNGAGHAGATTHEP